MRIQTEASKDDVMQNINVLIKGTEKQTVKVEDTTKKLEKNHQSLKQAIETLNTQLLEINQKEANLLQEKMRKNVGHDHQQYEQEKHQIYTANYALKTNINKKLTLRQKQKYEIDIKLNQAKEQLDQFKKNKKMYEAIVLERRRFLTYQYMHRSPNDVEEMVKALYGHFENIRRTCFSALSENNYSGVGSL